MTVAEAVLILSVVFVACAASIALCFFLMREDLRAFARVHEDVARQELLSQLIRDAAAYAEQEAHHYKKVSGVTWSHHDKERAALHWAELQKTRYGAGDVAADELRRLLHAHLGLRDRRGSKT